MPEGDTIFRAAANLRKVLQGAVIETATGRAELGEIQSVIGSRVLGIESRGKHLIIHFRNQQALHSHMGMTGSWHIYRDSDIWKKPAHQAIVQMQTGHWQVVCFVPKQIRLLTARQLQRDAYLQKLGPDILGPPIGDDVYLNRMRTQKSSAIGEAVMNQTVVCGIGNVYKSEILFLSGINPVTPVRSLSDDVLIQLRDTVVLLMKRNLDNGPRKTRFRGDGQKLWVYRRRGEVCLKCGETIEMLRQGNLARSTYFCPTCQPLPHALV